MYILPQNIISQKKGKKKKHPKTLTGTLLVVQQLRLLFQSSAGGVGLIPSGNRDPTCGMVWPKKKRKTDKVETFPIKLIRNEGTWQINNLNNRKQ